MTQKEQESSESAPIDDLGWNEDQLPFSKQFDDTYYSKFDGRKETLHTFIKGNDLLNRWPEMKQCTIGELGFGTGLNFLETVFQWNKYKSPGATLHFVSFEQFPLSAPQIQKALSRWPGLKELQNQFTSTWVQTAPIFTTQFSPDIKLSVHIADANEALPKINIQADAWYLDGFSPAKNPKMWTSELMQAVFNNSKSGTTFATYTAAGWVRRNLVTAGFQIAKANGFAGKRHMVIGSRV